VVEVDRTRNGRSGFVPSRLFWCVPVVFAAVAGLLLADPWRQAIPIPPATKVPPSAVDTTPVRRPALTPQTVIAGMNYRCSECHDLFPSPEETDRPLTQHEEIVLEHGINNRCFNCHHREDRNFLVDDRGDPIPFDRPPLLCAKCHGPVYRDWTYGVHGRTDGYWDLKAGPMRRLKCVECHDPHDPAFKSMTPAPGPNTLRMGDRGHRPSEEEESGNPLLIYRQELPEKGAAHERSE